MVVVYNCDERYAGIFAVSVFSLFECSKDVDDITVYLIDNGIKEDSLAKIQKIADVYKRKIIPLPMPDIEALLGMNVAIPAKSNRIVTCGRLFAATLLPDNIDKILYFDCDTIFLRSIKPLWEIDLGEYYAGMMADVLGPEYRSMLGIPAKGIYYNSGAALINLALWREKNIEQKFMEYLESQGGYVPWPDQGIFNAVLDGRILCLPCEYNVHTALFSFPYEDLMEIRRMEWYYPKEEVEHALQNPGMVHFTTTFSVPLRPWYEGCNHPYTDAFLNYRQKSPWKDEPLWKDERTFLHRYFYSICDTFAKIAPRKLYIFFSRQYYLKIRPLSFQIKKQKFVRGNLKKGGPEK